MIDEEFKSELEEYFELEIPYSPVEHIADVIFNAQFRSKFNRVDVIETILSIMSLETIKDNIDYFIDISIKRQLPEITAFLLDYKARHNLYTMPNWDL